MAPAAEVSAKDPMEDVHHAGADGFQARTCGVDGDGFGSAAPSDLNHLPQMVGSASRKEGRPDQMGSASFVLHFCKQCCSVTSSRVVKVAIDRVRQAAATDCRPGDRRGPLLSGRRRWPGMEAFDTAAASPSSMFGRPALFPSSTVLIESCRNCVQRLIAIDLETHIWPSAWLPHSSDKQDIGRSQNASNSCRADFLCTL
uniref:Uncharacterized protein n=1 Tax=Oryza punctata TaxID=4537 RepID=A0A0E0JT35_ORYPU